MAISSKAPAVKIPVELQVKDAVAGAQKLGGQMKLGFLQAEAAVSLAKDALSAMGAALSAVVETGKQAVHLAGVQEKAERSLAQAIKLRQTFTDEEFKSLQRFNAEVQASTTIGDEALLQLQRQLVLQGVEKQELKEVTKAVIGLSQVKGSGFAEAATVVTRVLRGEVGALKESGIVVDSVREGMEKLIDVYGIAEQETAFLSGQATLLGGNWGDMMEELGRTLTESPEVIELLRDMNKGILQLASTITAAKPKIVSFWSATIKGARAFSDFIQSRAFAVSMRAISNIPLLGAPLAVAITSADAARGVGGAAWKMATAGEGEGQAPALSGMQIFRDAQPEGTGTVLRDPYGAETAEQKRAREKAERERAIRQRKAADDARALRVALHGEEMDHVVALHKQQEEVRLAAIERGKELGRLELDSEKAQNELRFQASLVAFEERQALKDLEAEQTAAFYQELAGIGIAGMTDFISGMTESAMRGEIDLVAALQKLFGAVLGGFGDMLIALGTAAVSAAIASHFAPWTQSVTGGTMGIGGGLGLIAAGAVLKGAGSFVSAASSGAAATIPRQGGQLSRTINRQARRSEADRGTQAGTPQNTGAVYNINFNGALPGSERRIAKEIRRIIGVNKFAGATA